VVYSLGAKKLILTHKSFAGSQKLFARFQSVLANFMVASMRLTGFDTLLTTCDANLGLLCSES
jgi:hypothetical protein